MKTIEKKNYSKPQIEEILIQDKTILMAGSFGTEVDDFEEGGEIGDD